MPYKTLHIIICICSLIMTGQAQKQNMNWVVKSNDGRYWQMDFNNSPATFKILPDNKDKLRWGYFSCISDIKGDLLFYSSYKLIDKNGDLVYTLPKKHHSDVYRGGCLIPLSNVDDEYLFFALFIARGSKTDYIAYATLEQKKGLPLKVKKDLQYIDREFAGFCFFVSRGRSNVWTINAFNDGMMYSYPIDKNGLSKIPIVSKASPFLNHGDLSVSSDGKYISNGPEIHQISPETHKYIKTLPSISGYTDLTLSPYMKWIYAIKRNQEISRELVRFPAKYYLTSFDLAKIKLNEERLMTDLPISNYLLKIGPDKAMYMHRRGSDGIFKISNPDSEIGIWKAEKLDFPFGEMKGLLPYTADISYGISVKKLSCSRIQLTALATYARSFSWNFGDATGWVNSSSPGITHEYKEDGEYIIQLRMKLEDGTDHVTKRYVDVEKCLYARIESQRELCVNTQGDFRAITTQPVKTISWNFGDGYTSSSVTPTHTYSKPGNFTVTLSLTDKNDFSQTATRSITIKDCLDVEMESPSISCVKRSTQFRSKITGTIKKIHWDFGDGQSSTLPNPPHIYDKPGVFSASLTVTNQSGRSKTETKTITVQDCLEIKIESPNELCIKENGLFSAKITGTLKSVNWDFGDGQTSTVTDPHHAYTKAGDYTVSLTVTNGSGTSKTVKKSIVVNECLSLKIESPAKLCFDKEERFSAKVKGTVKSIGWDFGDGNTSNLTMPTHIYSKMGDFSIKLTVTNEHDFSKTITQRVTVQDCLDIRIESPTQLCVKKEGLFEAKITGTVKTIGWDFGDGQTSTLAVPTHTYSAAGNFIVSLTVTSKSGTSKNVTKPIVILAEPNTAPIQY